MHCVTKNNKNLNKEVEQKLIESDQENSAKNILLNNTDCATNDFLLTLPTIRILCMNFNFDSNDNETNEVFRNEKEFLFIYSEISIKDFLMTVFAFKTKHKLSENGRDSFISIYLIFKSTTIDR